MAKTVESRPIPPKYQQPDASLGSEWIVDKNLEIVDYLPQFNFRIWYNNEKGIYDFHYHDAMEILLCLEGQWTVIANEQHYHLNVGDILFVPPYMLHKLIFGTFGERLIYLVNTEILKIFKEFHTLDPVFMYPFLCTPSSRPAIHSKVYEALSQMSDIYFGKTTFTELQVYSLFLKTLSLIGDDYFSSAANRDQQDALSSKHTEYYEKFAALLNYIDANYN